ncbi:hypothetical protein ACLB2K_062141 [Fragaria x ananassa]
MPGEDVLEEAKSFSSKNLKQSMSTILNDDNLLKRVEQSLETPVHWRMPRIEALNFISMYERDDSRNLVLLELAKLDYNLVQSVHQNEIKELSRQAVDFVTVCLTCAIDDMYDVYGFLDELELFTDAVTQWNLKANEDLPEYMKPIYSAMFTFGNELADQNYGLNTLPLIKKEWENLCKSYMVEARWFYGGYTPTLEEYLKNAWTSVGGPGAMLHAYLLTQGSQLTHLSPLTMALN